MSEALEAVAHEIMALVDEYPSEPFSFERREVEEQICYKIGRHTQEVDEELDASFSLGYDEGKREGYEEATNEFRSRIEELEEQIKNLEQDVEKAHEDGVAEGYEGARIEYGL
jgi:flagellar biosynthesis/type III secretory pathway protein FliH